MTTAEGRARAAGLITYLVKRAERIEGRVRLQKSLYLLRRKGVAALQPYPFTYHHYGPYSDDLAALLSATVGAHAVTETTETFDEEWQKFRYEPGPEADQYIALLPIDARRLVEQVVDATRGEHWRTLELAATVDFLRREGTAGEAAIDKAIALKPACQPFVHEAKKLLSRLELS